MLGSAPEPVWMLVWGLALLVLASGARSLMVRQELSKVNERGAVAVEPRKVMSVSATGNWREALVAKLMADRAQASS